ncbi:MAG TPA: hypothetical protein VGI39_05600 [Polyangiaceae bacterium]|jgi:hypothetical protein
MGTSGPWLALWAIAAGLVAAAACGTSAVDVQACKDIEDARCVAAAGAPICGIDLSTPPHNDKNDATACIRFYETQCLHGLGTSVAPGASAVSACVAAIKAGGDTAHGGSDAGCGIVQAPELHQECAFLIPPAVVDAGAGSDAATDAGAD